MKLKFLIALAAALPLVGCSAAPTRAERPALIGHIVFVELQQPSDYDALLRDSDAMLATIPTVSVYAAGGHIDTGRDSVLHDYDLAIYLGFESESDLAAYVAHDQHTAYVKKWKPRLESLRVYDMHDPTP